MKSKIYTRLTIVFTSILIFTYAATSQTTISVQILDPADDAEEYASDIGGEVIGGVDLTSSDLELVFDSETQYVGMIFRDVQIPVGATITNAYVQFTVDAVVPGVTDAAISLEVYGAAEANAAAPFTEDLFSVSSHPSTTATVAWDPGPSVAEGDAGENEQTPDISTIITEIIAVEGWAAGNNLMIVVTGDPGQTENLNREMESADGDALSAPTLVVTYTEDAPQENTISVQIADAMDDIEESAEDWTNHPTGTIDASSSDLEFINEDGLQFVGMIFRNVQIPPNANITSAYIQFTSDKALDGPVTCELYGASEANVTAPFTEDPFSVSNHISTIAKVTWTPGPWGDFGVATEAERSPDISTIIAEIVALSGWASGNNLMIASTGDSLGKIDNREAVSYDGQPNFAPILNVTFTEGGGTGVNSLSSEFSSLIYPNPTEGKFNINNPSTDKFSYQIYTINGKLVESRHHITGPTTEVDLSNLAKGMYFVNVRTTEKTETHKIILK